MLWVTSASLLASRAMLSDKTAKRLQGGVGIQNRLGLVAVWTKVVLSIKQLQVAIARIDQRFDLENDLGAEIVHIIDPGKIKGERGRGLFFKKGQQRFNNFNRIVKIEASGQFEG